MNAVDILKYGHLTLLGSLEGLPDGAWTLPGACGEYSVQTLVGHMATMENVLADALGAFAGDPGGAHFAAYAADHEAYEAAERARFAALPRRPGWPSTRRPMIGSCVTPPPSRRRRCDRPARSPGMARNMRSTT